MNDKTTQISIEHDGVLIEKSSFFSIYKTFECGQCFRWRQKAPNTWEGVVGLHKLNICETQTHIILKGTNLEQWNNVWHHYFDWDTDYEFLEKLYRGMDPWIDDALNYGRGIRLLRQPFWETLVSFVLSANNNIPRIQSMIDKLCKAVGHPLGDDVYSFPEPLEMTKLTEQQLREMGFGYRAPFVVKLANGFANGVWNERDFTQGSVQEIRKKLKMLPGVGPKVADCILLFSLHRLEAFPIDTWIRKALEQLDADKTAGHLLLMCAEGTQRYQGLGYLQQMMFFAMRSQNRKG